MLTAGEAWFVLYATVSLSAGIFTLFVAIIAIYDRRERRNEQRATSGDACRRSRR